MIAGMFTKAGWRVEISSRHETVHPRFAEALGPAKFTNRITGQCDILLLYASDMVFDFHKDEFAVFERIQADRRVMALTYKLGKAGQVAWTKGWDRYLFLSSAMAEQFAQREPDRDRVVLAPPVDLTDFYKVQPDYGGRPRLVRHSSQGDKKYPGDIGDIIRACRQAEFHFMPPPASLNGAPNIQTWPENSRPVAEFLAGGNCFWYLLPPDYTEQGPRVIVEAMAAGLPVIAENRDGAADRVTPETGWLIDSHEEAIEIINRFTPGELEQKGIAARERAKECFGELLWAYAIKG